MVGKMDFKYLLTPLSYVRYPLFEFLAAPR